MAMPGILCFDRNPAETLETLGRLRDRIQLAYENLPARGRRATSRHRRGKPRRIDYWHFEPLTQISPAAALVLAAEYRRWMRVSGKEVFIANVEAWHQSVIDTLWGIGFFKIMGFPVEPPERSPEEIVVEIREGDTADGKKVDELLDDLRGLFPVDITGETVKLYGAMVDALDNVVGHAYPKGHVFDLPNLDSWWITGAVDRAARRLTAVVYDQGVSIPGSLPNWERYGSLLRRIHAKLGGALGASPLSDHKYDGAAIDAAVEEAATSSGESHRGKGLARMKNFVDGCREGHLRIMSRCGEVIFRPNQAPEVNSYETSIGGTLIEWNVLL